MAADVPVLTASTDGSATNISTYNATTLKPDYSQVLTMDFENETPFTTLMGQLPNEVARNSIFHFFVGRRIPRATLVATGQAEGALGGAVSLPVTSGTGKYFSIGDLIYIPSSTFSSTRTNIAIVTAVSTDTLTVYPNKLTKYLAASTTGYAVYRFGSSTKEGSEGRNAIQTVPTDYSQYVQTFEDYGKVNEQTERTDTWITEKEVARVTREKRLEHIQNIEGSALFSELSQDITVAGSALNPRYTMQGLFHLLTTNSYTYGSAMTQAGLYDFMATVHKPAHTLGKVRYVFASMGAMNAFNKLFTSALRIQPAEGEMSWKVNFTQITYLGFTWKFFLCPTISEFYDGAAIVFAPQQVGKKVLMPTEFRPNVQIPKANYREFGWRTVLAAYLRMEEAGGIIIAS